MNISIQIQVCRACLKPPESTRLTEYPLDSEILKNYLDFVSNAELTTGLPRTFCDKCVSKIKLLQSFRKLSRNSENYLKSFVVKINQEFAKSLPAVNSGVNDASSADEDPEIEQMLFDEQSRSPAPAPAPKPPAPSVPLPKVIKSSPPEKIRKIEKVKQQIVKIEKVDPKEEVIATGSSEKVEKEYLELESSAMYHDDADGELEDDGNIFGEEIYDIMEIDQEGESENIYMDDRGKQVLAHQDEDGEFILVNFKSSNEDLSERDGQFVVEELYDEDSHQPKGSGRKKHVNRMPRDIINKYAQSTDNNKHICTKCVKVFSTRTNLIRHIQSHDGHKAYVCNICNKGFTQSGSLKQHMYIHSGERPYKCQYCDRAFTQGKTLKFHIRRHTEEKPFICTECNSSFRQRDGLKRHLKSRHNIELVYERPNQLDEKALADLSGEKLKLFEPSDGDEAKGEEETLEGEEEKKGMEQDA